MTCFFAEPGEFKLLTGSNSDAIMEASFTLKNKIMNKVLAVLIFFMITINMAYSQTKTLYEEEQLIHHGDTLLYRVLWPQNFKITKRYPVVIFLHGAGERGNDNQKQLIHGSDLFVEKRQEHPAIVIFPQCPKDDGWANVDREQDPGSGPFIFPAGGKPTQALQNVSVLIDKFLAEPYTDQDRIYVGGLSMGGMGTFELVSRRPDTFAAAFVICGGGNSDSVDKYAKKVPFWVFHGAKDDLVPPINSAKMVQALNAAGGEVWFTLYPDANHNSWDKAFAEPELLDWLFSKTRTR